MKYKIKLVIIIVLQILTIGCDQFLDVKPNKNLVVPATLDDCQALMDNKVLIEKGLGSGEVWSDDYFLTDANYLSLAENFRTMYRWDRSFIYEGAFNDWKTTYDQIYLCNLVLETLGKIDAKENEKMFYNDVLGQALFHRAHYYFQAVILWGAAYHPNNAKSELGISLRSNLDGDEKTVRASVEECYTYILNDLIRALEVLPETSISPVRPTRYAVASLLGRVYLSMGAFDKARQYIEIALDHNASLMNFNSMNSNLANSFKQFNVEVIFESRGVYPAMLTAKRANVARELIDLYDQKDLRLKLYYAYISAGQYTFKGSYEGNATFFNGISTNENYLNMAECLARTGTLDLAIDHIINLWKNRMSDFNVDQARSDLKAMNQHKLIAMILLERRKELPFRGLRWMDLKRLAALGEISTMTRSVDGQVYELKTDSRHMLLPIPENIVALTGIKQN